jgi:hypothetical protein
MTVSIDRIADMAESACFYEDPDGNLFRILYCDMDEGYMQLIDDDDLLECSKYFDTITFAGGEGFYQAVKMNPLDN